MHDVSYLNDNHAVNWFFTRLNQTPPPYDQIVRNIDSPPPPYTASTVIDMPTGPPPYAEIQASQLAVDPYLGRMVKILRTRAVDHNLSMLLASVFLILSSVPMAALIVGAHNVPSCPQDHKPNKRLIVFGAVSFVSCLAVTTLVRFLINHAFESRSFVKNA